jgi:hypothetical protein
MSELTFLQSMIFLNMTGKVSSRQFLSSVRAFGQKPFSVNCMEHEGSYRNWVISGWANFVLLWIGGRLRFSHFLFLVDFVLSSISRLK